MSIITITRDSYHQGRLVADEVAKRLGSESLGREVVLEAADQFGTGENAIRKSLHDAPSFLEKMFGSKERHLAMYQAALYKHLSSGNVVFHGIAGHSMLRDVPNVLKVYLVSDLEERVQEMMSWEGITESEARERITRDDHERAVWNERLYGTNARHDVHRYDLCINLQTYGVDEAIDAIVEAATHPQYTENAETLEMLADMALAAEAKARLLKDFADVQAVADHGDVTITVHGSLIQEKSIIRRASSILAPKMDLDHVRIGVVPNSYNA